MLGEGIGRWVMGIGGRGVRGCGNTERKLSIMVYVGLLSDGNRCWLSRHEHIQWLQTQ